MPYPLQAWDMLLGFDMKVLYASGYAVTLASLAVGAGLASM